MTWRDELRRVTFGGRRFVGASFRGVPFYIESADRSGGRRTVVHEFPGQDDPYVEDLGRRGRKFPVEGYVVGPGYLGARDELIAVLEAAGPGELVHPFYGTVKAAVDSFSVRESPREGGVARVTIEFIEAPAQAVAPVVAIDFALQVSTSARAALLAGQAELEAGYQTSGRPAFALESLAGAVRSMAAKLGATLGPVVEGTQELARLDVEIRSLTSQASSLIRHPALVLGAFGGVLAALTDTIAASPGKVLDALVATYGVDTGPLAPLTTATRRRERQNQLALTAALRRVLAIEAARLAPRVRFASHEDAVVARDAVAALLDAEATAAGDAAYPALVQLRADLARAVPGDAVLARLRTIERRTATPSLLLSYQLYGSVDQEADILARNRVRHPGVIAGTLQVLGA